MAGLQRSEISFRRSGSSGLVWDDKFLQDEFNKAEAEKAAAAKTDEQPSTTTLQHSRSNREQQAYKAMKVTSPSLDPPSPKVSAGCCGGVFGKPRKNHRKFPANKSGKRKSTVATTTTTSTITTRL